MSELRGLRCLITGGMGFIGSNLTRAVVARGGLATVVDCLLDGCGGRREHVSDLGTQVQVVEGDARSVALLSGVVRGQDVVFSLAGKVSHIESMQRPEEDLEHNLRTAMATLEAVRQVNPTARVVFASTRQVYGVPQYLPVDERHPVMPVDVNGIHKAAAEQYHGLYCRVYGLTTVCLRLTNTYGPRQLIRHDRQGFIGWFIRLVLENRPLAVYGDGSQRRDFLFVDDAVEALLRAGTARIPAGTVVNVPGAAVASLAEFSEMMCEIGRGGRVQFKPFPEERRAIDIGDFYSDGTALRTLLGWQPSIGLESGLTRTFDYYRDHWRRYVAG